MIIQLPLENWTDLLPLVPRHQLVEIVKQLGDRQFAKILQFFLTEVGQITLGHLRIVALREHAPNGGGPIVKVQKPQSYLETKLPEGPIPANVKDFKLIELSYFDPSVANFLRQFQQVDNVNLWFFPSINLTPRDNTIMPILVQLMPMIGNININSMSIYSLYYMGFGCAGLGPNNAASQVLTRMLTNARILEIHYAYFSKFPWCDWLNTPRMDGKPRALRLSDSFTNTKYLIERIKKDFSKAIRPISFFVYVRAFDRGNVEWHWQDICLDNGQNERLIVKSIDPPPRDPFHIQFDPEKHVLISRYPIAANQEWIGANEQEIVKWDFRKQNRQIRFDYSLDGTKW